MVLGAFGGWRRDGGEAVCGASLMTAGRRHPLEGCLLERLAWGNGGAVDLAGRQGRGPWQTGAWALLPALSLIAAQPPNSPCANPWRWPSNIPESARFFIASRILGGCAAIMFRCGQENRSAAEIASRRLPGGRAQ